MTQIAAQDYCLHITAYRRNGVEIFIHIDGSVYAPQIAIARFLYVQASHLNAVMARKSAIDLFQPQLRGKIYDLNKLYGRDIVAFGVDTIVALAAIYKPKLFMGLTAIEVNEYLYSLVGYDRRPITRHKAQVAKVAALPDDNITFDEMCDRRGIDRYPKKDKAILSRSMAKLLSVDLLAQMTKKYVAVKSNKPGLKPFYYKVNAYPLDCLGAFDRVVEIV